MARSAHVTKKQLIRERWFAHTDAFANIDEMTALERPDIQKRIYKTRLSLETGAWPYFAPARGFYQRHGFVECAPFGNYVADPNSVFMTLQLQGGG